MYKIVSQQDARSLSNTYQTNNSMAIRFDSLTKSYGTTVVLDSITFSAFPGRITGFIGPNGAGKTTALKVLLGLSAPTSGTACFDHIPINEFDGVAGILFGTNGHASMRTCDYLEIRAKKLGLSRGAVATALEEISLSAQKRQKIGTLSLGQRQRLSLASALLGDPDIIILDEPMNGLDPDGLIWLREKLRAMADAGRTVLVSSHLLAELSRLVDDVVILNKKILWAGSRDDLEDAGYADIEALYRSVQAEGAKACVS